MPKCVAKTDGLGPYEIKRIHSAVRQCWHRSYARALVVKRCTKNGWTYCEACKQKTPKLKVDHITAVGSPGEPYYIQKLFCPSAALQGLCKNCHDAKTKLERQALRIEEALG